MYSREVGLGKVALLNSSDKNCTTLSGVNESPRVGIFALENDQNRGVEHAGRGGGVMNHELQCNDCRHAVTVGMGNAIRK